MKTIQKIGKAKLKISTPNVRGSEISLDFTPIIEQFNLDKGRPDYKLIHWQGRPKGVREWGIYDPQTDSYRCGIYKNHKMVWGGMKLLMLDDKTAATLPSAVLYLVGTLPVEFTGDSSQSIYLGMNHQHFVGDILSTLSPYLESYIKTIK